MPKNAARFDTYQEILSKDRIVEVKKVCPLSKKFLKS